MSNQPVVSPGADPTRTRQWAGAARHRKHLEAQERERRLRRGLNERKPERKKKR